MGEPVRAQAPSVTGATCGQPCWYPPATATIRPMAIPTEEEIAAFVRSEASYEREKAAYEEIMLRLRSEPAAAKRLLSRLMERPEHSVRQWAAATGTEVCGKDFVPTLQKALTDRSEGVRSIALEGLLDLDPQSVQPGLAYFRRRLRQYRPAGPGRPRRDPGEAGQILWALARMDAREARGDIREFADRADSPYLRKQASVVLAFLEEGEAGIIRRLRDHDHDHTLFLCRLIWLCGTEKGLEAIRQFHDSAPDEDCQRDTEKFLSKHESILTTHSPPYWDVPPPW